MKTRFGRHARRQPGSRALILLLLLAVTLLALAPAALAAGESPDADDLTFRVGWLLEPDNLNPFIGLL